MARQKTFGEILRDARERKGIDLPTAARRLRIRPDILRAIEEGDYNRMPPRGYTRNMVNAYARMVGLNPADMTRLYLDDAYAHQVERARTQGGARERERAGEPRRPSQPAREAARAQAGSASRRTSQARGDRILLDERGSRHSYGQERTHPSRHPAVPTTQYTNFYAGPKKPLGMQSKLPFLIIGAVVVIAIVVVVALVAGGKEDGAKNSGDDVTISGLTDTSNPDTGEIDPSAVANNQAIVVTPDRVTFVYAVPAGLEAYIEVYEGEDSAPSVAQTVAGPAEKSFEVTETLTFVTTNPGNVTIYVAGQPVEVADDNDDGVYTYEVDFAAYLADWKEKNQPASSSADNGTTGNTEDGSIAS